MPLRPHFGPILCALACAGGILVAPRSAGALGGEEDSDPGLELPRDPDSLEPALAGEVHLALVFPLVSGPVCPEGAGCVLASGGGVGASVERRWPWGIALGLAYDVWFLDSNGVFELGVLQELRGQVRHLLLRDTNVHPYLGLGAGALLFGDTLKVSTLGFAVDLLVGVEVELTETISFVLGIPWRLFTTAPFTTPRDRVPRSQDGGINATVAVQVGLAVVGAP